VDRALEISDWMVETAARSLTMCNRILFVSGAALACVVAMAGCGGDSSNGSNTSAGGNNAGGAGATGGSSNGITTGVGGSKAGGASATGGSTNSVTSSAGANSTGGAGTTGGSSANPGTGGSHSGGTSNNGYTVSTSGPSNAGGTGGIYIVNTAGASSTGGTSAPTSSVGGVPNSGGTRSSAGGTASVVQSTVVGPPAVDLLLMVDNSSSMADKQAVLATAVPQLLARLAQPNCLDSNGEVIGQSQMGAIPPCAQGTAEFKPANNIHVGIVTSSLGDHGADRLCSPGRSTSFVDASGQLILEPPDVNDMSHLVGTFARYTSATQPTARASVDPQGFLAWGDGSDPTISSGDLTAATAMFQDMATAAHELGCGLEAQLESWFRFLIDPVPPVMPIQRNSNMQAHRMGSDDALLAQRAAFLRPNSVLAIIMLTDENDCSLRDTDVGWVPTDTTSSIKTGSSMCASNPNDKCCYSCTASGPPVGCDNGCGTSPVPIAQDDGPFQANLRCWHQKRRFGYDFMYPTSRYVVGLTKPELCPDQSFGDMDCDCTYANKIGAPCSANRGTNDSRVFPNPLYSDIVGQDNSGNWVLSKTMVAPRANNSSVFLAGIIGVPWQDIGYADANGNLNYIPVTDPAWTGAPTSGGPAPNTSAPNGIWQNISGDDNSNTQPGDVHMVESVEPRPGIPSNDPGNGHEYNTAYEDLEYACIFQLPQPRACACSQTASDYSSCKYLHPNDCCDLTFGADGRGGGSGSFNKPLCNGNTQVAAKAYPGLREIAVLRDYATGDAVIAPGNSIVTSICPKDTSASSDVKSPGYGYNPAMGAIINRLKEKLPPP
jgi:hypothetical protein